MGRIKQKYVVMLLLSTILILFLKLQSKRCPIEGRMITIHSDEEPGKIKRFADEEDQLLRNELKTVPDNLENIQNDIHSHHDIVTVPDQPDCEVIHVAVVCQGYLATRNAIILTKSILFNRKNPLHFHFIADNIAKFILKHYFETWGLPSVSVSFYSTEDHQYGLDWASRHLKTEECMFKLALIDILPNDLDKVLVLDPDVEVVTDIAELWKLFLAIKAPKAIGAVENQHNLYLSELGERKIDLPILGRGVNTGVLLYNLEILRNIEFQKLIKQALSRSSLTEYILTGEDILNLVLSTNLTIFQKLDEKWNIQLTPNLAIDCCNILPNLKVINWQSNAISDLNCKCIEFYRGLDLAFREIDGNILKRTWFGCNFENLIKQLTLINRTDNCADLRRAQTATYRTHLYYMTYEYELTPNDVTLVTQMDYGRLGMFWRISQHWNGPISVAIYMSDAEATALLNFINKSIKLSNRTNIGYHIIYKETSTSYYPVNRLRNIALSQVKTPYVFLCDVDFMPNFGMYEKLKKHVESIDISDHKKALVVPAFETYFPNLNFPDNKADLLSNMKLGNIRPFRLELNSPHGPTNYTKWEKADTPYKVFYKLYYEPYLVLPKDMPIYYQQFYGFGYNKLSHTVELYLNGYEFIVLPDVFIIHLPHGRSLDKEQYYEKINNYFRCVKVMVNEFKKYLAQKYGQRGVDIMKKKV